MFEMLLWLIVILVVYIVAVAIAVKHTTEKMGARSGLFGGGLVSVVVGFVVYAVIGEVALVVGYGYWTEAPSWLYYAARFGFLILGISGIVMVAVDLLRTIRDLGGYISRVDEKITKNANQAGTTKKEAAPAWKRVQMESEE